MGEFLWDFSDFISTNSASFPSSPNYEYVRKDGLFTVVEEIALAGDSAFITNGYVDIRVRRQSICSQNGVPSGSGVRLLTNFSAQFRRDNVVFVLAPGESIEAYVKSNGTDTVKFAVSITGAKMLKDEIDSFIQAKKANGAVFL